MKLFILIFSVLTLSACGGGYNPDKAVKENARTVGASTYEELSASKWRMTDLLKDISSGANFEVTFTLADNGSVTVHTFANSALGDGVNIQFTRIASALNVTVSAGTQVQDWSSYFSNVDASQPMTFTFDVHNNERPAHVLVWQGPKNASLNHRNTLYNSAEDSVDLGFAGSPGNGTSRYWGISFTDADITNALSSTPQETHE
ncbi:hypothetical protein AZI86_03700 [Bdellovibrio bacteriovorus]|uniref:Lipoprotein n=1 Tax=Bdellovibrio bacteriovorus TaxID=959 RepID=A0A150WPQ5_BDEBC|nr:hypothetical protein [Bdellovibrio bacteriovorus]KYG66175.1 hypothetical protein AZI86_03700 [Bdellovibrio bacteriovorus]